MKSKHWALIAWVMSTLVGCGNPEQGVPERSKETVSKARLVEVQRYGVIENDEVPDPQPAGGAVLGQIAKAVDDEAGNVYVLDAGFKKVAVFNRDGSLKRVILGGHGEGPGEFRHPTSLWLSSGGDQLAVFDYSLNRVTVFDTLGVVLGTFHVQRAKDIALEDGRIIGTQMPDQEWIAWVYSLEKGTMKDTIRLDARHTRFYSRGSIARIGNDADGNPVIGHHRPGLVLPLSGSEEHFLGTELIPGAESKIIGGIEVSPAATFGVGRFSDGSFLVGYVKRDLSHPDRLGPSEVILDILTGDGERIHQVPLGTISVTSLATSRDGESLLLAVTEPFPQVVRFRLEPTPGGR